MTQLEKYVKLKEKRRSKFVQRKIGSKSFNECENDLNYKTISRMSIINKSKRSREAVKVNPVTSTRNLSTELDTSQSTNSSQFESN